MFLHSGLLSFNPHVYINLLFIFSGSEFQSGLLQNIQILQMFALVVEC